MNTGARIDNALPQLQRAITLSEEIFSALEHNELERAAELSATRMQLIQDLPLATPDDNPSTDWWRGLQRLEQLEQALNQQASAMREDVKGQLSDLQKSASGARAYREVSRQ